MLAVQFLGRRRYMYLNWVYTSIYANGGAWRNLVERDTCRYDFLRAGSDNMCGSLLWGNNAQLDAILIGDGERSL